ncbi:MAG: hypothetical protein J5I54_06455 [Bacteroidales bacterium]|nr:hypothetical protein [Bacteroidales bacterium]
MTDMETLWWDNIDLPFKVLLYHNYLNSIGQNSNIDLIEILSESNISSINSISSKEVSGISKLEIIERVEISDGFDWIWDDWFAFSNISAIDYLKNLKKIKLEFNKIEAVDLDNVNNNLIELDLYQNNISDISFLNLFPNLERLNLGVNKIFNIEPIKILN